MGGDWLLKNFNPTVGGYLMLGSASMYASGVGDLSNAIYGGNRNYDFLGRGYRNAAEFYGFDFSVGDYARAAAELVTIYRGWTTLVSRTVNSGAWGTSAMTYTKMVPAIKTSTSVTGAADAWAAKDNLSTFAPNN
ncbi:hypothetical protein ACRRS0_13760 [Agarivorans sp. QJM3NY_29]|uniref:hypothetical protein n=1 Tax=unclassified Agarivorans TaxID=2636026 RepID=UPI003D7D103A